MLANDKDLGFWHLLPEKPGYLQSIHARHADIEKDQVGLEFPGFHESLSGTELWQVSLLVRKANQLSEPVRQSLHTDTTGSEAKIGK